MRFDPEIYSGLVVLMGCQTPMDSVAIDQQGETALLGEGTELSLGEDGMGRVQKDMLELSRPGLMPIVEDFDAPNLVRFQRSTDGLVDLPMRYLTVAGLVKHKCGRD